MSSEISGQNFWLNINKPIGYSSAQVVKAVKKITGAARVGHAGTLDPFATGVLPIAVNRATKTCEYFVSSDKKYYFEIAWGQFRDTDDITGKIIETSDFRPSGAQIVNALSKFIGKINQVPSAFSAIRVNGKQSYKLARRGVSVELKSRLIEIHKIKLLFNNNECAGFEIDCSKGTYVRSFARDLAVQLGACGYVSKLQRLKVGSFLFKDTISLAKLKNIVKYSRPNSFLLQLRDVLDFIPEVELNNFDAVKIKNGQIIKFNQKFSPEKLTVKVVSNGVLIALAKLESNWLKPINTFV